MLDITHQRKLESDLQQAQKLESVGRLASGVAHEINTPVQFVSDNITFLRDAHADLVNVYGKLKAVSESVERGAPSPELAAQAAAAAQAADMPYLFEEMPNAYASALEGLKRVAVIVSSMKEFARADMRDMAEVDINRAIQSTLVIAANEYKYVADVETELGELPPVLCHGGEINQVVLNIVINAAHAIADVVKETGGKGRITVRTHTEDPYVVVTISDTGGGIPDHIRAQVFDPFFTTKPVGKGTGQGLAIARSVIVDKHGGQLTLQTQVGSGSSFQIKLPIRGAKSVEDVAA
jgi:signal transduction histidine kinase